MFHFILLASLPFTSLRVADYVTVNARAVYPKIPYGSNDEDFIAFLNEWGPYPPWLPHSKRPPVECNSRTGCVTSVSDKFLEIRDESTTEVIKLPPHHLLATGRVVVWESDPFCYLLSDVKKGDIVRIRSGTVDPEKGEELFWVSIRKRPGGRVPPTRKITRSCFYHLDQQAKIDHEEKGTPLPERLRPRPLYLPTPEPKAAPPPPGNECDTSHTKLH